MTNHQDTRNLHSSRLRRDRQTQRPARLRRALLAPMLAAAAVMMLAMPVGAQLGGVTGDASGAASGSAALPTGAPDLPAADAPALPGADVPSLPDASTDVQVDVRQDVRIDTPEVPSIDIDGHAYQVISYADIAASHAGQVQACGSLQASSAAAPVGLASYADVCDHLDADALYTDARGMVQAAQLPDTSWVTMPDLHQQLSIDISADAQADTGFLDDAVGRLQGAAEATAQGAKSLAGGIKTGFQAGVDFFGGLF